VSGREPLPPGTAESQNRFDSLAPGAVCLCLVEQAVLLRHSPQHDVDIGRVSVTLALAKKDRDRIVHHTAAEALKDREDDED
jgi:hypothetical protein